MAGDDLAIRAWEVQDRGAVQRLLRLLSDEAEVRAQDVPVYVAEYDGRLVGMVTLCIVTTLTGPKAFLDHLVVDPDFRRRGIGRALLEYAIERARGAGASRIDLTANRNKQAGRALYESIGFRERDTAPFRFHLGSDLAIQQAPDVNRR